MLSTLRWTVITVLLIVGVGGAAGVAAAASSPPPIADPAPVSVATSTVAPRGYIALTPDEKTMLALINRARARRGLARVSFQGSLERAARAHSADMIAHDYFSHRSRSGASLASRLRPFGYGATGYSTWSCGEVIGWGKGLAGDPHVVFRQWMKSAGHRQVILARSWRDVGVGRAKGTFQGRSGVRMYTIDFGRRCR